MPRHHRIHLLLPIRTRSQKIRARVHLKPLTRQRLFNLSQRLHAQLTLIQIDLHTIQISRRLVRLSALKRQLRQTNRQIVHLHGAIRARIPRAQASRLAGALSPLRTTIKKPASHPFSIHHSKSPARQFLKSFKRLQKISENVSFHALHTSTALWPEAQDCVKNAQPKFLKRAIEGAKKIDGPTSFNIAAGHLRSAVDSGNSKPGNYGARISGPMRTSQPTAKRRHIA